MREWRLQKKGVIFLLVLLISLTAPAGGILWKLSNGETVYLLYVGLNDRNTYEQIIPTEEARRALNEICLQYVDGYTIWEAAGTWRDETGTVTEENTLICSFSGVTEACIQSIMDELLVVLNQNAILMEKRTVENEYYYGVNGEEAS